MKRTAAICALIDSSLRLLSLLARRAARSFLRKLKQNVLHCIPSMIILSTICSVAFRVISCLADCGPVGYVSIPTRD